MGFKVGNRCGNTGSILSGKGRLKRRREGEECTEGRENALLCVLSMKRTENGNEEKICDEVDVDTGDDAVLEEIGDNLGSSTEDTLTGYSFVLYSSFTFSKTRISSLRHFSKPDRI